MASPATLVQDNVHPRADGDVAWLYVILPEYNIEYMYMNHIDKYLDTVHDILQDVLCCVHLLSSIAPYASNC